MRVDRASRLDVPRQGQIARAFSVRALETVVDTTRCEAATCRIELSNIAPKLILIVRVHNSGDIDKRSGGLVTLLVVQEVAVERACLRVVL